MKYVKLSEACTINMGQSPDSSTYNDEGKGIPFYQGNADFGEKYPKVRVWCFEPTKIAQFNDILISVRAPIGALNYADTECCIGRGLASIKPIIDRFTKEYIFYLLKSKHEELNKQGTGSTFKAISKKVLENVEVPNISINDQVEIVERLDKIATIIDQKKNQINLLDNLIKSRFVELFGNVRDNEKNWEKVSLKSVAEVRGRVGWKGYKKDDLRESGPLVLGATHLTESGCIDLSSPVYLSREKYEESPEIMLQKNDLIFTQRGNTIGKVGLLENDIGEATINPCVLILRPLTINPIYFKTYFILDETKSDMWSLNAGSAQPMITQKGIGEYMLMLPPLELQEQFATFVNQTDKSKLAIQKSIDETQKLFDSLMQEYFG